MSIPRSILGICYAAFLLIAAGGTMTLVSSDEFDAGQLVITARNEAGNDKHHTSARINTRDRFAFRYGGNWLGASNASTEFPVAMAVDNVRLYS